MIDETQIEQLILDELGGIISPEDSATLKKLLEEEPEARIIRNLIYEQFSGPEEQAFLALLPEHLPVEQVWAKIRKRIWIRVIVRTTLTVILLALAAPGIYILFVKPEMLHKRPANVHGLSLNTVVLQLPDGEIVKPGSQQQQVKIGNVTFHAQAELLSIEGYTAGKDIATLIVPPGKDYKIQFADGTTIQLNADSKISFPVAFGNKTREVTIAGEAYLSVAKDTHRPFIAHLPKSTLYVLGTEFNVNTYNNAYEEISLVKGAIRLKTDSSTLILQPGFSVKHQQGQEMKMTRFDPEEILAWRMGTYVFRATTIAELFKVVKRWYGINIICDNPDTGQRRITGYIDKSMPLQHFLDNLAFTGHLNYYFDNDGVLHIK
ncbi:FecR family protein [Chitinophaga pinensis]|uniref:DUF4974 domain-containing protein n=1 Tax=Chitinophaga pinensis TaxID=79329 RepID=A0A5C6LTW2_9BACT|nr:FecR domain-containing protein [Chitinophaga pinensis]TWW00643.1 DUF4974 domain-containing protein [Chitinophaga pinensis]